MRYHVCQFSDKTDDLVFLGPNLPNNGFWGCNFKNLSLVSESVPPRYHMSHFLVKMENFGFFCLNLAKLPNYVRYFGSNIVERVAKSWVKAEMSWVEVDGARWRWVHSLVTPNSEYLIGFWKIFWEHGKLHPNFQVAKISNFCIYFSIFWIFKDPLPKK